MATASSSLDRDPETSRSRRSLRFLLGGLGSRGLFWMPYLAPLAALAIAQGHNDSLPPELSVSRFA